MEFNDLTVKLHLPCDSEGDSGKVVLSKRPTESETSCSTQHPVSDNSLPSKPPASTSGKTATTLDSELECSPSGKMAAANTTVCVPDVVECANEIDPNMPATGIGWRTTNMLSQYLRPPRQGSCDWRDMAEEMGFSYQLHIQNFALENDPVAKVIAAWCTKAGSTIGKLIDILEKIERHDVLSELPPFLEQDCKRWRRTQEEVRDPIQVPEVSGNFATSRSEDLRGITLNDSPTGPVEMFDAYVCFDMADIEFVQELRRQLESPPHNFKLCIDQRDLLPGGSHALVTAEIIKSRCNKMLVVLSPEFLLSRSCDFQTKFAVSLDSGAMKRRIIPILVKACDPPLIIRHLTSCDYTKKNLRPWFWGRLVKSMSIR